MTTQAELLELAKKYKDNNGVKLILLSLSESRNAVENHLSFVETRIRSFKLGIHSKDGYSVHGGQSEFVQSAYELAAAVERMAWDFTTLACMLEGLGEEIKY